MRSRTPKNENIRTDSENPDFINLVMKLDAYLKMMDGAEHAF